MVERSAQEGVPQRRRERINEIVATDAVNETTPFSVFREPCARARRAASPLVSGKLDAELGQGLDALKGATGPNHLRKSLGGERDYLGFLPPYVWVNSTVGPALGLQDPRAAGRAPTEPIASAAATVRASPRARQCRGLQQVLLEMGWQRTVGSLQQQVRSSLPEDGGDEGRGA